MSDSSSRSVSPDPAGIRPYVATRRHRSAKNIENEANPEQTTSTFYSVDPFQWRDDDLGNIVLAFRSAAAQARLPYDRLSELEFRLFGHVLTDSKMMQMYLFCRNKILVLWNLDPMVELTPTDLAKEIPPPFNSDMSFIQSIHAFLQRYGYINFGVMLNPLKRMTPNKPKVIVIGAGVAGITVARQLQFFGVNVKVLEGRKRTGGRVFSHNIRNRTVNLGAQIITGIVGNPIITLAKQCPATLIQINQRCPIFGLNGKMVDPRKDDLIQSCFNKILETCSFLAHSRGIIAIAGQNLSLGKTFNAILNQQELRVLSRRIEFYKTMHEISNALQELNKKMLAQQMSIERCMEELKRLVDINTATSEDVFVGYDQIKSDEELEKAVCIRQLRRDLLCAVESYEETEKERAEMKRAFSEFKIMEPNQVFMNLNDRQILDFHTANLEYGIGAPINQASLKYWDHDDDFGFDGSHLMVLEGYEALIGNLARGLSTQTGATVQNVKYSDEGVEVTYKNEKDELVIEKGDAVVCTVPLGVLKASVLNAKMESAVQFEPPLPPWKQRAITNLGYGSLNKLVLIFDRMFWDADLHTFGRLNDTHIARGEMFLFFADGVNPVLTALIAGNAASEMEAERQNHLIIRAMTILQLIFGSACPKDPIDSVMTLWHNDPFSLGCYSYVSTKSTSEDYDTLAAPLSATEDGPLRVFFAGEHTNREHTATVHGAFLSGTRVAAEIANTFFGPIEIN